MTLLDADGNTIAFGATIIGRLALRVNNSNDNGEEEYTWVPPDESFPSIDKIMKENLGILAEESTGIFWIAKIGLCLPMTHG